jgi:hypothetical protein
MNSGLMVEYLRWLRVRPGLDDQDEDGDFVQTIYLQLDHARVHCTKEVIEEAERLNIQLIFIPASCTDMLQPLDIGVFGPFKAKLLKF